MKRLILLFAALMMLSVGGKADYTVTDKPVASVALCKDMTVAKVFNTAGVSSTWGEVGLSCYGEDFEVVLRGAPYTMKVKDIYSSRKATGPVTGVCLMDSRVCNTKAMCINSGVNGIVFLNKAEIIYTPIGDNTATLKTQDCCDLKVEYYGKAHGVNYYRAEITAKFPLQNLYVTLTDLKYSSDSQLGDLTKDSVDGIIITQVKLYGYQDFFTSNRVANDFVKQYEAGQKLQNANAADVNRDGTINAADVVEVYNSIINGGKEQE